MKRLGAATRGRWRRIAPAAASIVVALAAPAAARASSWTALMVGDSTSANAVTPIAVDTDTTGAQIYGGDNPFGIAVSPDGQTAYVADFNANGATGLDGITPIDVPQGVPEQLIPTDPQGGGRFQPLRVAISPDGTGLWTVSPGTGELERIDLTTSPATAGAPVSDGTKDGADSIALSPDGRTAYVTDEPESQVSVLDLTQSPPRLVGTVSLGPNANPVGIGISPDGSKAFVADLGSANLSVIDTTTLTNTNVALPASPYDLAVAPDGNHVYLTAPSAQEVIPVDVSGTTSVGTPIPVSFPDDTANGAPQGIAITPDGAHLYVGDGYFGGPQGPFGNETVDIALPAGTESVANLATPDTVRSGVVTPDQAPMADFTATSAVPGQPVAFDASSSTVAVGSIVSYAWNFGDGTVSSTTTPTTTHVYGSAGTYTASVTETDSAGTSTAQVYTGQSTVLDGGPSAVATKSVIVSSVPQPAVALSTSALDFGSAPVGQLAAAQTVTLTNSGQAALRIATATIDGSHPQDFAIASDGCSGETVAPSSSCSIAVTFRPSTGADRTAGLAIADDASGSPQLVRLHGVGSLQGIVTGTVGEPGSAAAGAPVQICPQGGLRVGPCQYGTTDRSGRYTFAGLLPGRWAMQVQPPAHSALFGGSATLTVNPGVNLQNFSLTRAQPLPPGVSLESPAGTTSHGVPTVTWAEPVTINFPVRYRSGPPGSEQGVWLTFALDHAGASGVGPPIAAGSVFLLVSYDRAGRPRVVRETELGGTASGFAVDAAPRRAPDRAPAAMVVVAPDQPTRARADVPSLSRSSHGASTVTVASRTVTLPRGTHIVVHPDGSIDAEGRTGRTLARFPPPPPPCPSGASPTGCPPGLVPSFTSFSLWIDPSRVLETPGGVPVAGGQVVLQRSSLPGGPFAPVPHGSSVMSRGNRRNPYRTSVMGTFGWDVLPGYYRVTAQHARCRVPGAGARRAMTGVLTLPPPPTAMRLVLACPGLRRSRTRVTLHVLRTRARVSVITVRVRGRSRHHGPRGTVTIRTGHASIVLPLDSRTGTAQAVLALHGPLAARYSGDGYNAPGRRRWG